MESEKKAKQKYVSLSLSLTHTHTHTYITYESESEVTQSLGHVRLFATPWTIAYQAPLSMGFSRQ